MFSHTFVYAYVRDMKDANVCIMKADYTMLDSEWNDTYPANFACRLMHELVRTKRTVHHSITPRIRTHLYIAKHAKHL